MACHALGAGEQLVVADPRPAGAAFDLQGRSGGVAAAGPAQQVRDRADAFLDAPALFLAPHFARSRAQRLAVVVGSAQFVAPQAGQVGPLIILIPVNPPHVHVEDSLLFGGQRLVEGQHALGFIAAVEGRVRAEQVGEVLDALESRLKRGQAAFFLGRCPALGQVLVELLLYLQRIEVLPVEGALEAGHRREGPIH